MAKIVTYDPTPETVAAASKILDALDGTRQTNPKTYKFFDDASEVYDEALSILLKKHRDYGPKNIALSPGGPLNGLRVRMWDKTARINNLIDSGATPENESLRDSFLDLMNYAAIAMMVLDGNWPSE